MYFAHFLQWQSCGLGPRGQEVVGPILFFADLWQESLPSPISFTWHLGMFQGPSFSGPLRSEGLALVSSVRVPAVAAQ